MKRALAIIINLYFFVIIFAGVYAAEIGIFEVKVNLDAAPPQTKNNYDGLWHNTDFIINLIAVDTQSAVVKTYYKINNGQIQSVDIDGQPVISAEGDNNCLEYWSADEFGNEEVPHKSIVEIKLDKTLPVVNITSPKDGESVEEESINIVGVAIDEISDIESVLVDINGKIYNAKVNNDYAFSIESLIIAGGVNNIKAICNDMAGNQTEKYLTVYLGWKLYLEIPYYTISNYYSGSACSQMVLNYIRKGVIDKKSRQLAEELTQEEIYQYGWQYNYSENNKLPEMDAQAIDYVLGHFDPHDSDDLSGQGNSAKGYNFGIESFETSRFTEYLRDIIHWMAYPVKIDSWWLEGELTKWPNVPAVVPAYGTYEHWIVVNGAATSENPIPAPYTAPYYTPDFTVYGIWLTDPLIGGIGKGVYVTAQEAKDTYLFPLVSKDKHSGRYIQVAEPPQIESNAYVKIAEVKSNEESLKAVEIINDIADRESKDLSEFDQRLEILRKHLYDDALAVELNNDRDVDKKQLLDSDVGDLLISVFDRNYSSIELDWSRIIDASLLSDDNFRKAFDESQARSFIKVCRTDKENSFYYLIPFDKYIKGQFLTCVAIIIDVEKGSFKEASWVNEPTRFIQVSKEKAKELIAAQNILLQNKELELKLVWEPNGLSSSPFYPYWKVVIDKEVYYVTQEGKVIKEAFYNE